MSPITRNHLIRNVFDQYRHAENRMTHALVQTLAADEQLLARFARSLPGGGRLPRVAKALLTCQVLPGERLAEREDDAGIERRGLPDAWVYDSAGEWAYAIECKLESSLSSDQLHRHAKTLNQRFSNGHILAITADYSEPAAVASYRGNVPATWWPWTRVYQFFAAPEMQDRARDLTAYMRLMEERLMTAGSDKQITTFSGIPFGPEKPYNTLEARALLRALHRDVISSLRTMPKMQKLIAAEQPPKPMTGEWAVITLAAGKPGANFTEHPHFTVVLGPDFADIELTLPNSAPSGSWRRLARLDESEWTRKLVEISTRVGARQPTPREQVEPTLWLRLIQRHFYVRRYAFEDGTIAFDIDNLMSEASTRQVRAVSAWLPALRAVLAQKSAANLQFQIEARFPYGPDTSSARPDFPEILAKCAEAFEPLLNVMLGRSDG